MCVSNLQKILHILGYGYNVLYENSCTFLPGGIKGAEIQSTDITNGIGAKMCLNLT
jgi:hypothetical protein